MIGKPALATLCIALCANPLAAQVQSATDNPPVRYCSVSISDADGEWQADRAVGFNDGKPATRYETYSWEPAAREEIEEGLTLRTSFSVQALSAEPLPRTFAAKDTEISFAFYTRPPKPGDEFSDPGYLFLHFYRETDPGEQQSVFNASLVKRLLTGGSRNTGFSFRASFSIDDVLAFGQGYDTLVWNVRGGVNKLGGTTSHAEGALDIGAIRARLAQIPKLRRALDRKAARFAQECEVPPMAPTLSPLG